MSIPDSTIKQIDDICTFRTYANGELDSRSVVYKELVDMNNAFLGTMRATGMNQKSKVLTLISLHVMGNVPQSIEFAVSAAIYVQATDDEILDAIEAALLTGGGQAVAGAQFAEAVLKYRRGKGGRKPPAGGFQFKVLEQINVKR